MYDELASVYLDVVGDLPYRGWADFIEAAWRDDSEGAAVPVRRVLDVGCGTGLLTRELIERGYELVGVDASDAMLAQARRLLGPDVPLGRCTLPDLTLPDLTLPDLTLPGSTPAAAPPFDAAVSTFDCLNYLRPDQLEPTLSAVAAALRPDGWFVFDLHTEAMMRAIAQAPLSATRSGALDLTMSTEVDPVARRSSTRVHVVPDGSPAFDELHVQHFFTDDEVGGAVAAAGLRVVEVTDDYTSSAVGPDTLRATWVTRRVG